jgi:YD repeat-containing protein
VADPTVDQVGVAFRVQDASNYWDVVQVASTGKWRLNKVTGGALHQISETADPDQHISAGDHLSVYCLAAAVLVYVNGRLLASSADTDFASSTGVGLVSASSAAAPVAKGFMAGSAKGSFAHGWFDNDGRAVATAGPQMTLAGLASAASRYDADGNLTASTDANGNTSETGWGPLGRMSWQSTPAPQGQTGAKTTYAYDALGRVTQIQAPGKNPDTFSYHFGPVDLPDGAGAWMTRAETRPDGSTTTAWLDGGDRPVEVNNSATTANPDLTYTWDAFGRLVGSTSVAATGTTISSTRSLDSLGDVLSESKAGRVVSYHYDSNPGAAGDQPGLLASIAYPGAGHTVTEGYTSGRWTSVTDWNSHTTSFDWGNAGDVATDPNVVGQLRQVAYPNGTAETRNFDSDGQVSRIPYEMPT